MFWLSTFSGSNDAAVMAKRRSPVVLSLQVIFGVVTILVGPIQALIAAGLALSSFKNVIIYSDYDYEEELGTLDEVSDDDLRDQIYFATGMTITVSVLGIIIKLPLILFHFLTIFYNVVNVKTKLLCLADIVTSFVLAGGNAVSGILLIVLGTTVEWINIGQYKTFTVEPIIIAMIASGAFCFLSTILFLAVAIYMLICFVITEWSRTTVYTPGAETHAVTNEQDEDIAANEQTTSFIA